MKKLVYMTAIVVIAALTSCGGHSGATGEQIDRAKEEAHEMLNNTKQQDAPATTTKSAEMNNPADANAPETVEVGQTEVIVSETPDE